MIGKVIFIHPTLGEIEAILHDNGRWTCPVPETELYLNSHFTTLGYSPARGERGHKQINQVAKELRGRPAFTPTPAPPADAVL